MNTEERHGRFIMAFEDIGFDNELGSKFDDKFLKWLDDNGYFTAPASTKYHGAYEGGLFDHCLAVYDRLANLTENNNLIWQRRESPFIIGMFHDLCKCDQYIKVPGLPSDPKFDICQYDAGYHYEYDKDTILKGHGSKSVMLLSQFITLTEEEMLCIRYHMGAYEKDEWAEFDMACRKYPNLLFVHLADQLASKIDKI